MGKKTSKTTSTSAPWQPAQGMLLGAGQGITDIVNKNQPNLESLAGDVRGMIPGIQHQIGDTKEQLQPGLNYAGDVLGGKYLNTNPWTDAMRAQAGQDAGNAVNSTFSMAGRTGSGNHATDLARGVAQAENGVMFQNYQNERGNQNGAAGMLPGLTGAQYQGYTPLLGASQLAGQLPYYGTNPLSSIGGLYGGYGTQTATQPGGWMGGLLGAASNMFSFSPIKLSDRRLKTNIRKIGEWDDKGDGLGKYEWNWKSSPNGQKVVGVIADEVEKLRPWAFVPNFVGQYAGVNYGAL